MQLGGFTVLLQVFDMPTSLAFYRDVLGFTVAADVPADGKCDFAMLALNGSDLMLNTAYEADDRPKMLPDDRRRAHRDTALFFDCADVDAAYARLIARGLRVTPPAVQAYGMKQIYLEDPDGYELCLQQPARYEPEAARTV